MSKRKDHTPHLIELLRGAHYSLHSPQQAIARSDRDKAISKRDCHVLWARNDTFLVVPNVTYFTLSVISTEGWVLRMIDDGFKMLHQGFLGGSCSANLLFFIRSSVER
jgi:hypothetical protein